MVDEDRILMERYKLGDEISRDASTITYKSIDLDLSADVQITLLTDYAAAKQFQRAAKEDARRSTAVGELALISFCCTKDGRFFTVYGKKAAEKSAALDAMKQ